MSTHPNAFGKLKFKQSSIQLTKTVVLKMTDWARLSFKKEIYILSRVGQIKIIVLHTVNADFFFEKSVVKMLMTKCSQISEYDILNMKMKDRKKRK